MSCETCQFCEKVNRNGRSYAATNPFRDIPGKVKYGVRHYACYGCFLEHKGAEGLRALPAWKVKQFPYKAIEYYGLTELAKEIIAKEKK